MAIYLKEAYLAVLIVAPRQDKAAGSLVSVSFRDLSNLNVLRFSLMIHTVVTTPSFWTSKCPSNLQTLRLSTLMMVGGKWLLSSLQATEPSTNINFPLIVRSGLVSVSEVTFHYSRDLGCVYKSTWQAVRRDK
jgi:hypothetical protein